MGDIYGRYSGNIGVIYSNERENWFDKNNIDFLHPCFHGLYAYECSVK